MNEIAIRIRDESRAMRELESVKGTARLKDVYYSYRDIKRILNEFAKQ